MEEFKLKYKRYFLTSESVTEGHPDKVADLKIQYWMNV